jgi:hypothetical protein
MKYAGLLLIPLFFLACAKEATPEQTVIDNFKALQNENVELYMSTVSGARADAAGQLLPTLFADYDVLYTIDTLQVLSNVGGLAQVRAVVTAKDKGGPKKYHDNQMVFIQKLENKNGKWFIISAEIERRNVFGMEQPKDSATAQTAQDTTK